MDEQVANNNQDKDNNASDVSDDSALLELKNRALNILLPLVDKVDEPPERKFEILMTAARSSDDSGLLNKALDAAQHIGSDNEKANAVLDVLNEINYHLRG